MVQLIRDEKGFFSALETISEKIRKLDDIVVIHHYDADGLTSGAIAIKALEREGKKVTHLCLKQLYKENIAEIKALGKNYLFVDFGSGQTDYLKKDLGENNTFILDHHEPIKVNGGLVEMKYHANPLLFGIDGGKEISGAGVTFFFALALNKKNSDLSSLAIVGALGDMQDFYGRLEGLNRKIIEIAEQEKLLSVKEDLRLYGRISRPLVQYLLFASNPTLPELTANEKNCKSFLKENGIPIQFADQWLSYEDLTPEQKKKLSSALITQLAMHEVPEWKIKSLIGEVYTLEKEESRSPLRDGKEFATVLNSCVVGETNLIDSFGRIIKIEDLTNETLYSKNEKNIFELDIPLEKHILFSNKIINIISYSGKELTVTADHKILVFDEKFIWKKSEEINVGDFIVSPSKIKYLDRKLVVKLSDLFKESEIVRKGNLFRVKQSVKFIRDIVINSDFCEFFGFLLGDGHVAKTGTIDLVFGGKEKDKLFIKFKKTLHAICIEQKVNVCNKENFFNAKLSNHTLASVLYRLGVPPGKKNTKITLDKILPLINKVEICSCIKGLFESDAYLSKEIEFSSHSKISYELQALLLFFGVQSTVRKVKCGDCNGFKYRLYINLTNSNKFYKEIFKINKRTIISRTARLPIIKKSLFYLSDFYGFPPGKQSNFCSYKKGTIPSNELLNLFLGYFESNQKIVEIEVIKFYQTLNLENFLKNTNSSKNKFSKETGLSRKVISQVINKEGSWRKTTNKIIQGVQSIAIKNKIAKEKIGMLYNLINSRVIFDKVISKTNIRKKTKVFDLTMLKNSNYIANGIIVHNCGRHARPEVGLGICLGDRDVKGIYGEALALLQEHRIALRKGIGFIEQNGVQEKKSFYFFDAGTEIQDSLVGIIAGMLYGSVIQENKPIIAIARNEDNTVKISGRATSSLVRKGLNLGGAFKELSSEMEGVQGGGHKLAAGLKVNKEVLEKFLEKLDEKILAQLS